ncbi:hypothetical protein AHAS_Ahas15G0240400 [Arachis hypogaea]
MSLSRDEAEFSNGVNDFLDFAYSIVNSQGEKILCPCAKYCNFSWHQRQTIYIHLVAFGFVNGYTRWIHHWESLVGMDVDSNSDNDGDSESESNSYDDMEVLLNDKFREDVQKAKGIKEGINKDAKKFYNFVEEASKELYLGCKGFFTLCLSPSDSCKELYLGSKLRKTRGKTRCLKICTRTWEESEEVTFDYGEAMGSMIHGNLPLDKFSFGKCTRLSSSKTHCRVRSNPTGIG